MKRKSMSPISVNYEAETIELTRDFTKKASDVDSAEYKKLIETRKAYPAYKVIVRQVTKTHPKTVKGITREFMYEYAKNHEKEDSAEKFAKLQKDGAGFAAVKSTFYKYYPEFKTFTTYTQWILAA